ncbi:MAG: endonuclease MutS2 [Acidobacteria bacterium]|nr:endonuclease MutS2 [Acidobacteriota bacterium]
MHTAALRALEFDRIVEAVRTFALTPMGDERLARLRPSTDAAEVADLLASTTQASRYIARQGGFPLRAVDELPDIISALATEGRALEAPRLLALSSFLDSVEDTRAAVHRMAAEFPLLERAGAPAASFKGEIARVRAAIDPAGDVVDDASPALRGIRDRLRRQKVRLRGTLESYLRGKDTSKYLQDQVVTERNGRYVLLVKAEHRGGIPGIVHGASASGASLFLEPLSTVDINNDIVALEEQEFEEVRRILLELTDQFRGRPDDIARTVRAATELDVLQARARYSDSVDGIEPALSTDGAFELLAARHPLLKAAVPVTIRIIPPATVLLVTGPNTGGKTVALKTAGLLALMAQSGLRIPVVDGSRLPVFRTVFADIGDEQSIEASLSTFSAHITNIASMDRDLAVPGLVLLDEIGSGTDPAEGGALGVAVIDHFRRRGATIVATSHYDALKSYASTTEGVQSAAFGFDAQTFAPTYQLVYGSPGRSLALEIAGRLGLSPAVIAAARRNLSAREAQLAEHLAKIDRDMRALEHDRRIAARERETLAAAEARMREREQALRAREDASKKRLAEELDRQVRDARRQIDGVIEKLKQKTDAMAHDAARRAVNTGASGAARVEAREAVEAIASRLVEPAALDARTDSAPPRPVTVGAKVVLGALGLEGVVTSMHADTAEVDVRGKRMRAAAKDLRVIGSATPGVAKVNVHVELQPRDSSPSELNVIGCTVDEALTRVERFMDESLLNDQRVLRFVHGHGTGQLKKAITKYLQQHPLVATITPAPPNQGGGGVTIAELKD